MLFGHGPDEAIFETYDDDDGQDARAHRRRRDRSPSGDRCEGLSHLPDGLGCRGAGARRAVAGADAGAEPALGAATRFRPAAGRTHNRPANCAASHRGPCSPSGAPISGDDYAAVAAAAPGVTRAAAAWEWDADEQRPIVRVYVGDDAAAVTSAQSALVAQADPNRPLVVVKAIEARVPPAAHARARPELRRRRRLRVGHAPRWSTACSHPACSGSARCSTAAASKRSSSPCPAYSPPMGSGALVVTLPVPAVLVGGSAFRPGRRRVLHAQRRRRRPRRRGARR